MQEKLQAGLKWIEITSLVDCSKGSGGRAYLALKAAFGELDDGKIGTRVGVSAFKVHRWKNNLEPTKGKEIVDPSDLQMLLLETDAKEDWLVTGEGSAPEPRILSQSRKVAIYDLPVYSGQVSTNLESSVDAVGSIDCIPWVGPPRKGYQVHIEGLRPQVKSEDVLIFDLQMVEDGLLKPRHVVWAEDGKSTIVGVFDKEGDTDVLYLDAADEYPVPLEKWTVRGICVEVIRGHKGRKPIHYRYLDGLAA